MLSSKAFLPLAAVVALLASVPALATDRGLAWPGQTGGQWTGSVAQGQIRWYHHYDQGGVPGFEHITWLPMFWGPQLFDQWNQRKQDMQSYRPPAILAFNEPDQPGQANMSPDQAAQLWSQELAPYQQQGIIVSSPQMSYDQNWLASFMNILQNQYGHSPDVIALHFYGSADDNGLNGLKSYVENVRNAYGKNIYMTELGVIASTNPSEQQVNNWMHQALNYLNGLGYVDKVAWFGDFAQNQNPDGYVSNYNALFSSADDGSLTQLGADYVYNGNLRRSTSGPRRMSP
ncbi:hypothetical protein OC835_001875 [Tilletia horrida]|uniref:Asl1-like glycosyl hydrolase catalytic domain-containing protein n=1 Tax=Tilletia horrida TaxID=155126 RepID=A0AAN6GCA6_9BASI|nr:hypothetical protein OC842_004402 [Tilletia horrida]KAK0536925.1 hypothetical protein OC835_001875 [Tilletia horrida]